MIKAVILFILLASPAFAAKTPITLLCQMLAESSETQQECNTQSGWGTLPFYVPPEKVFCVTHIVLQNKFPFDPPDYGRAMRTMYFQILGFSASAHHPETHFNPPLPYGSNILPSDRLFRAYVMNGQTERQWIYGLVQGFLIDEINPINESCWP